MLFNHPKAEKFESFRKKIDDAGIRCVSFYAPTIKEDKDLDEAIRFARILGASNITGDPTGDIRGQGSSQRYPSCASLIQLLSCDRVSRNTN